MTRTMLTTQLFAAAAMLLVTVGTLPAAAQTFDAAVEAYKRGDYATALAGFQNYAEQGNAAAQLRFGRMYANGEGVPKDDAEAVRWYRLAAEQGTATAQFYLGVMYDNGKGVPEDDAEAVRWYRLAAEQGTAAAQFNLGLMYDNGEGVPEDDVTEAYAWFNIAAEQGSAAAQFDLALMYANGKEYVAKHMTPRRRGGLRSRKHRSSTPGSTGRARRCGGSASSELSNLGLMYPRTPACSRTT